MTRIRQHLSTLLFGWLLIQLVGLAMPVVLAASGAPSVEELCTCAAGGHETCPMHHSTGAQSHSCGMRSTRAPSDVALLSLAGGIGVLPHVVAVIAPSTGTPAPRAQSRPLAIAVPPDSPPPRV